MASVEKEAVQMPLTSTILAKKIATYIPSSLSIDDIKLTKNKRKSNYLNKTSPERSNFIPPSPSVSFHSSKSTNEIVSPKVSKFAFLLGDKVRTPKKSTSMTKMKYELPNVQKVGTSFKNLRPVLAVSFSDFSLSKTDNRKSSSKENSSEAKAKESSEIIIPEAKQIDFDLSD